MPLGKTLLLIGLVLSLCGVALMLGDKIPWIGKLPGDIRIERQNFTVYFPLGTCVLLSLIFSLLVWLFRR